MINSIDIKVETIYLGEQSDPSNDHYIFAYTITIANTGDSAARLLKRHWIITDANGHVEEIKGDGVVGEQPYLKPGETFGYTSGAVLSTPVGCMQGSYQMIADSGATFVAEIPVFSLAIPNILH